MKYVVIDNFAVDEIVGSRFLQSIEFEQGKALVAVMSGHVRTAHLSASIVLTTVGDGLYITGQTTSGTSKYLVIDEEQASIFGSQTATDALFSFQKLLRFAKKIWQSLSFTFSERLISGSSKAVLFPFRYKPTPFRIVLEREPLAERLERRGQKGNWLLAYKAGHESGDANKEVAELTNFRKAFEAVQGVRTALAEKAQVDQKDADNPTVDQFEVVPLSAPTGFGTSSLFRSYDDWLHLLTQQQMRFVETPITKPARIEGAAGTGKTLTLILKSIHALRESKIKNEPSHIVFITHSDATKRTVEEVALAIDSEGFVTADRNFALQSLKVCTLSELCADVLRQSISESEFIDRDAMESKELQLLYISHALEKAMDEDYAGHVKFISTEFKEFIEGEDRWRFVTMLQHEFSVVIKGRASEDLDRYKKIPPLKYGIPVQGDADKGFIFTIFRLYQNYLSEAGQFDTDDVVLTTIGQLDTPIWRRRRVRDGFDAVMIDETHLFNINELHLFHYFTRKEGPYPIVYSVDRSQAVGDKGWSTQEIASTLGNSIDGIIDEQEQLVKTVFRSSPEIVNLAFSVLSSGATLFTNFDNPMDAAASGFTEADEKLCADPLYLNVANEHMLIEKAFERAEVLQGELGCRRSDILIVSLSDEVVRALTEYAVARKKPVVVLKRRGDSQAVEAARESGQWVVAHADFVGGLEFHGVVIVGVDGGRIPPSSGLEGVSSKSFLSYVSHNRLYVAVSRARYRVEMIGEKARGPSRLIIPAIDAQLVSERDMQV